MVRFLVSTFMLLFLACNSPDGAPWAIADFDKHDRYYLQFPKNDLHIGMEKKDLPETLRKKMYAVGAANGAEIYAVDRWEAVVGPDYISERLYLKFEKGQLIAWKTEDLRVGQAPNVTVF